MRGEKEFRTPDLVIPGGHKKGGLYIGGMGARWVLLVRCIGKIGWLYRESGEACRFGLYINI
jgi:hypothetical protein